MTTEVQIHYIHKNPRLDRHHPIEFVGGAHGGANWKVGLQRAVDLAKSGTHRFYTYVGGHQTWVVVATSAWGNEYLKTERDTTYVDNLLSLPEFPAYFPMPQTA